MDATPIVLLIRPIGQSNRLLSEIEAAYGSSVAAVISPIMRIEPVASEYNLAAYDGVILTSVNAVRNATGLQGKRVYCVGNRTRIAATKAGGEVFLTADTGDALCKRLLAERPKGKLMYLHGTFIAGDVAKTLNLGGLETDTAIVYDQVAKDCGVALRAAIEGNMPAILPLYSPRSALLLGQRLGTISDTLKVIAISKGVAEAWKQETGNLCDICVQPDGAEMISRIVAALKA